MDDFFEVVWIEIGAFSPNLEAVLIDWFPDEVHRHVFDDGHVLGAVVGS